MPKRSGKQRPELADPPVDGLVRHVEPALGQEILDVAEAQCKPQVLSERGRLRDRLLATAGLTVAERAVLLHAQVIEALLGALDADLARLDARSGELAVLLPTEPSARAARGAVLVLAGRREGRELLEADLATNEDPFGRGMRRAFLARAALDAGDRAGAMRLLAAARVDLAASASVEGEGFPLMTRPKAELSADPDGGLAVAGTCDVTASERSRCALARRASGRLCSTGASFRVGMAPTSPSQLGWSAAPKRTRHLPGRTS